MVRWLLSAALLVALPVADLFAADQVVLIGLALAVRRNDAAFRLVADRVVARLCRSKEILKI